MFMKAINPVITGPETRPGVENTVISKIYGFSIHMWNNILYWNIL